MAMGLWVVSFNGVRSCCAFWSCCVAVRGGFEGFAWGGVGVCVGCGGGGAGWVLLVGLLGVRGFVWVLVVRCLLLVGVVWGLVWGSVVWVFLIFLVLRWVQRGFRGGGL